jgi:hypothetical protein
MSSACFDMCHFLVRLSVTIILTCYVQTASVVSWSEFLVRDPEVPGSIPGTIGFSEKQWVWNGVQSASWVQLRSYFEEKVAWPV